MRIKLTFKITLLVLVLGTLWSLQAGAYNLFTAEPPEASNCSQCHSDWPGATHSVHTAAFDCGVCHTDDLPVPVNACAGCHPAADLLTLHSPLEGPGDMNYCGYCHAGTDTYEGTLDHLKALYR